MHSEICADSPTERRELFPATGGSLPFVNGSWDQDSFFDFDVIVSPLFGCVAAIENSCDTGRVEVPLGDQTVRRKSTLQSRRGYTIKIHMVATNHRTQLVDIKMRVLDLERIEGPFHAPNAAAKVLHVVAPA